MKVCDEYETFSIWRGRMGWRLYRSACIVPFWPSKAMLISSERRANTGHCTERRLWLLDEMQFGSTKYIPTYSMAEPCKIEAFPWCGRVCTGSQNFEFCSGAGGTKRNGHHQTSSSTPTQKYLKSRCTYWKGGVRWLDFSAGIPGISKCKERIRVCIPKLKM